jgi:hypothetical protein
MNPKDKIELVELVLNQYIEKDSGNTYKSFAYNTALYYLQFLKE